MECANRNYYFTGALIIAFVILTVIVAPTMKYLIICVILTAGCVKSEHDFITAPPGLTSGIYEQLIKIENDKKN